jgi:hypothetical protein
MGTGRYDLQTLTFWGLKNATNMADIENFLKRKIRPGRRFHQRPSLRRVVR